MNNIQKSFKNKAKQGLRMAVGGVVQPMSDPFGFNNPKPRQELQRQSPLGAIDNRIAMNTAIDSSNMTMSEKAALGLGTSSADASALRTQTSALSSLRESMRQQPGLLDDERQTPQNFADGGVVDPVEALLARTKASYGVSNASQPAGEAPRPAAPPVSPAPQTKGGLLDRAVQGLRGRAAQIDKAAGMAQGGVVKISGPGTGTSDDIPLGLRSNGKKIDVNVSNGEALAVLPAKTAADPQAVDAVNEIIETTNGKPPKGLRAGGHYADGTIDEQVARAGFNRLYGNRSAAMALPVRQPVEAPIPEQSNTAPVEIAPPASLRQQMQTVPEGTTEKIVNLRHNALYGNRPYAEGRRAAPAPVETSYSDMAQPVRPAQAATTSPVVPIKEQPAQATPPAAVDPAQAAAAARADLQSRSDAYGKSVDLAQQVMRLPQGTDMMTRGNAGLRAVASNPAVRDVLNIAHEQQGDNIQYGLRRGADGKPQVMISGGAPTKSQYVGADGKPTSDWTKTQDYSDAIARNKADKTRLAEIQRENMLSDLQSGVPFYQQRGLRALAGEKVLAEADAARGKNGVNGLDLAKYELDVAKFKHDLRKTENLQANNERDADFKDNEAHTTRVDNLLKSWASGEDGKLDNQKYAYLQKYAGQFKRGKGMTSDEHLAELMDNFAVDNLFEQQGRHWSSAEGPSAGEAVLPKTGKAGLGALLDARMPGQSTYVDPLTKRTIYQSDVISALSPRQQKILQERLAKQR